MTDWDLGSYEHTAERLAPAAEPAVAALRLGSGERAVVAREAAAREALDARFATEFHGFTVRLAAAA